MPVLTAFGGLSPRIDPTKLPDGAATVASNVRLQSGAIEPWRAPVKVGDLPRVGVKRAIYRFGQDEASDAQHWLHWTTDVDVVRSTVAGNERTFFTGDGAPKVTDAVLALTGVGSLPNAAYGLGVPSPTLKPGTAPLPGGTLATGATATTRYYVMTFVNAWGEEGGHGPISDPVVAGAGHTITLAALEVPTGAMGYASKRIYESGGQGASSGFFLKAEIPAGDTSVTFNAQTAAVPNPDGTDTGTGSALVTARFTPPPADLRGLRAMPGGLLLGISGNKVRMSEPDYPYAWPAIYEFPFESDPVAVGVYGNTAVVATKGRPYVLQGVHPSAMQSARIEDVAGCVSKRSLIEVDGGVVYATATGLVLVNASGVQFITAAHFAGDQWAALNPATMFCAYWNRRIFAFHATGTLVIEPGQAPTMLALVATAAYVDPLRDALYVAIGNEVLRVDSGAPLTMTWRSKSFPLDRPRTLRAVRLRADGPAAVRVFGDGVLRHSASAVAPDAVVTLPAVANVATWAVEVESVARIREIAPVYFMDELRGA